MSLLAGALKVKSAASAIIISLSWLSAHQLLTPGSHFIIPQVSDFTVEREKNKSFLWFTIFDISTPT